MKSASRNTSPIEPRGRSARVTNAAYESHFDNTALFEFSTVINSSLDLNFICNHILLTIMGKIMSSKAMVILVDHGGKHRWCIHKVKGFDSEMQSQTLTIPRMPTTLTHVDKLDRKRHAWAAELHKHGVRLLLPLMMEGKPIGALGFGERFSKHALLSREKTYLKSLANISATAIAKSHTISELQLVNRRLDRKVQELNTLFDLGKEFGALLDPEKLVRLLVFSLLGQVGVNRYVIAIREGSDMRVVASKTDGGVPQAELLNTLAQVKAPVLVSDFFVRGSVDPRPVLESLGLAVVVPMQLQGEPKGIMVLGGRLNKDQFTPADLEFLASLANLAIISLENARLFKEALEKQKMENELMIARDIQKGLLPSVLPTIEGVDIAASNISSKQVGGDYYDVIQLADGRYIIAIGDVSGKGTPAALLMANIQATIRALVPLNISLAELTGRVNDLMCQNTGGNKFVTFFWGYLDPRARTLTYVNAGHNYPYLYHAKDSHERLDKGGMILGIMPTMIPYEEAVVSYEPGDLLVMFTDGVSEAMSKVDEEFGEERLESTVAGHRAESASQIINAVHEDIQKFTVGAPQSDDITMMVLRFGEPPLRPVI